MARLMSPSVPEVLSEPGRAPSPPLREQTHISAAARCQGRALAASLAGPAVSVIALRIIQSVRLARSAKLSHWRGPASVRSCLIGGVCCSDDVPPCDGALIPPSDPKGQSVARDVEHA